MSEIDILFLQRVIFNISFSDHVKKLKNLSLVGNTGYFDNEVDYAGSEGLVGLKVVNIKPHVDPFVFPVVLLGAAITVCAHEHADYLGFKFEGSFAHCKSSPFLFVATSPVFGACTGGLYCVAPNQEGSAIAALRDQSGHSDVLV